jgi:hypothetical protein
LGAGIGGHGRLGPYSIVWYDALTPSGEEYVSAYVALDGKILGAQCNGSLVRLFGTNSTYPPTQASNNPTGFTINVDFTI